MCLSVSLSGWVGGLVDFVSVSIAPVCVYCLSPSSVWFVVYIVIFDTSQTSHYENYCLKKLTLIACNDYHIVFGIFYCIDNCRSLVNTIGPSLSLMLQLVLLMYLCLRSAAFNYKVHVVIYSARV